MSSDDEELTHELETGHVFRVWRDGLRYGAVCVSPAHGEIIPMVSDGSRTIYSAMKSAKESYCLHRKRVVSVSGSRVKVGRKFKKIIAGYSNKDARRKIFLEAFSRTGSVAGAAYVASVQPRIPLAWAKNDDEFKRRMEAIKAEIESG